MVDHNSSQCSEEFKNIVFKHFVELENCKCLFGSARDSETGRSRLFLIFNHGKIYSRNGLKRTWEEIKLIADYDRINRLVAFAISNQAVPCYRSSNQAILN
ncbi:MAG: hypothetical protein WC552_02245 [Candidatus Omnitrophota bacterium]